MFGDLLAEIISLFQHGDDYSRYSKTRVKGIISKSFWMRIPSCAIIQTNLADTGYGDPKPGTPPVV
jgi:hypothetical protein